MAGKLIVRKIREDELDQLLELYTLYPSNIEPMPPAEILQSRWERILSDPNIHYIVVEYEGKIVSTCYLAVIPNMTHGATPIGFIENVATAKIYENMGFGKMVLSEAKRIAKEVHCHKLMLLTGSKEERTLQFYEKAGFDRHKKTGFIINFDVE